MLQVVVLNVQVSSILLSFCKISEGILKSCFSFKCILNSNGSGLFYFSFAMWKQLFGDELFENTFN